LPTILIVNCINIGVVRGIGVPNYSNSLQGTISMIIYSIYKATNIINKKVYIGFTKYGLKRSQGHIFSKKTNNPFHNALRKYGKESFTWEIIYQSIDQDHTLNVMEPYFIKEYNSYIDFPNSNGYNATPGGSKNYIHSKQALSVLSNKTKLQWQDPNYRQLMVNFNKAKWSNPEFLSRRNKGWEITTPTNEIIISVNLAEFCREHSLDNGCMVAVSKGNRDHHKGYTCKRINLKDYS
jgi:hypothetical protein